jgi:methylthioribose-1-phosphate isomerase
MTESLKYSRGSLEVLDQLLLPHETKYVPVNGVNDAWSVIRTMQVRGAPLIAITAVLGLAVELANRKSEFITNQENLLNFLSTSIAYLRTSRPTAVNLFIALDEVSSRISSRVVESSPESLLEEVVKMAEDLFAADVTMNKEIGRYGADKILSLVQRDRVRVLTICNTGSLATAGYGTALGVVRALHERGALEHVYACETRPYNQGARPTA